MIQSTFKVIVLSIMLGAGFGVKAEPAPDFLLPSLMGGQTVQLSSLKGKVVYLDFWASWCAPCVVSLPEMSTLYRQLGNQDFELIAINLDESQSDARRFLKKINPPYPVVFDEQKKTPQDYSVSAMPMAFLIDRNGRVRETYKGYKKGDKTKLLADIQQLLQESP